jgi:carbon-monoxide dehydrogenase medium subunit
MYAFTLDRPASLADAVSAAASGGQVLAGGQTMLPSMKMRLSQPGRLVDLGGVKELVGIEPNGNAVVIGAMTRHMDVANSSTVKSMIPALADLASHIGDRQVRAMGTLGGSVANNDPSACYPSAVLGLGATVHTNKRRIEADDFFLGMFTTALEPGELITAISFPQPKAAAYMKFVQAASRFALVGVFLAQTAGGVRVAITGASQGVFRHKGLEDALNKSFTLASAASVHVDADGLNADIHASAAYRGNLISVLTQRAVAHCLA